MSHPCVRCGACCATFRVSFHWSEVQPDNPGGPPTELVVPLRRHEMAMRGTDGPNPRCVALRGTIGVDGHCGIYPQRPSVCRDVDASWEFGAPSRQCDQARMVHGLPPLTAADWRWRDDADNDDHPDDHGNSPSPPALPPVAA